MRKLLIAAVVAALLTGWMWVVWLRLRDPIDSAETCAVLETAMYDAAGDYEIIGVPQANFEKARQDAQDAWAAEVLPRIGGRYSELSCTFDIYDVLFGSVLQLYG